MTTYVLLRKEIQLTTLTLAELATQKSKVMQKKWFLLLL